MKATLQVLGRLTKPLELKENKVQGSKETFLSTKGTIAYNHKEKAHFLRFEVTGRKAEVLANYTDTGSRVYLTGNLESYQYEFEGKPITNWTLKVVDFEIIDGLWNDETLEEVEEIEEKTYAKPVRKTTRTSRAK